MTFFQLYLTGAVYSLDGSDSLKETMQTGVAAADKKVTSVCFTACWPPDTLKAIATYEKSCLFDAIINNGLEGNV